MTKLSGAITTAKHMGRTFALCQTGSGPIGFQWHDVPSQEETERGVIPTYIAGFSTEAAALAWAEQTLRDTPPKTGTKDR